MPKRARPVGKTAWLTTSCKPWPWSVSTCSCIGTPQCRNSRQPGLSCRKNAPALTKTRAAPHRLRSRALHLAVFQLTQVTPVVSDGRLYHEDRDRGRDTCGFGFTSAHQTHQEAQKQHHCTILVPYFVPVTIRSILREFIGPLAE